MSKTVDRHKERLLQCFKILESAANAGSPCPANTIIAERLGYSKSAAISNMVNLLSVAGLIAVEKVNGGRIVTICKTGKTTETPFKLRVDRGWTKEDDAALMEAVSEGMCFGQTAKVVGRTRFATTARFNKLRAGMGAQAR